MGYLSCLMVFVCLVGNGVTQWPARPGSRRAEWLRVVSPTLNITEYAYIWNELSGIGLMSRSKSLIGSGISRSRTFTEYNKAKLALKLRRDIGKTCFLFDVPPALIGTFNKTSTDLQALRVLNTTVEKSYQTVGAILNATSQRAFDLQHPFIKDKCSKWAYNYMSTTELAAGAAPPPASDKFTVFTTWGKVHLYILQSTGLVPTTEAPVL
ncbi:uncharacterized protein 6-like [Haliotis asinina]|uniref:uncharacterized protein 6-like n=1 Tax=Haliotis asinina TaxID=109174 RepID=UPI00353206E7